MDGCSSELYTQERGIRQGCPLSPHVFIILMAVLLHDAKADRELNMSFIQGRLVGTHVDEVTYADGTTIFSERTGAINRS